LLRSWWVDGDCQGKKRSELLDMRMMIMMMVVCLLALSLFLFVNASMSIADDFRASSNHPRLLQSPSSLASFTK
jgi:amino acid permease